MGDIGKHFPDTDPRYKGADSCLLLAAVMQSLQDEGWCVGNVDATVIAEHPKLAIYIPAMREKLALILGVHVGVVNIKATTTEKLGFTGRGEGIAAQSVVMIHAV